MSMNEYGEIIRNNTHTPGSNNNGSNSNAIAIIALIAFLVVLGVIFSIGASRKQQDNEPAKVVEEAEETEADTITADTSVRDRIYYGTYEQDNDPKTQNEPIEWIVLDRIDDRFLLITSEVIDSVCYNNAWTETNWDNCSLRSWLNGSFYERAFSENQKSKIVYTNHIDEDGNSINDQVFILDSEELRHYFSIEDRAAGATSYAKAEGVYVYDNGNSWWWVRNAGDNPYYAVYVNSIGDILPYGILVFIKSFGVRPAIWVSL